MLESDSLSCQQHAASNASQMPATAARVLKDTVETSTSVAVATPTRHSNRTVLACRAILVGFLAASTLPFSAKHLDMVVAASYGWLRSQWWFAHDSFEPILATISFFPPLVLFYVLDHKAPWARTYRINPSQDMSSWQRHERGNFSAWPILVAYVLPLLVFDWVYPRRSLPASPPSALGLISQVAALLVVYDALFFVCHYTLHSWPTLYRRFHKRHHQRTVIRAFDTLRLSFVEELIDVSCSIVAVNLLRAHPLARAIYNVTIVYLLIELHSNYDMPWMLHNVVPFGLMGGPVRHEMHHRDGRFYFQKFFTYLDNWLLKERRVRKSL